VLKRLHSIDPQGAPVAAASWTALTDLDEALSDPAAAAVLGPETGDWLAEQISDVRGRLAQTEWELPAGIVHGDAGAGNLLSGPGGAALLCDWDWVGAGPVEADLIPTWHAARRYGRNAAWVEAFVRAYGYDLAASAGFDTLMQMRDLIQLGAPLRRAAAGDAVFSDALRERLAGIRNGDAASRWRMF